METSKPFENNNEVDEEQEFDEEEPSWIELEYRARTSNNAEQIGYSFFESNNYQSSFHVGGVQDDYILGPGDEVVIFLQGAKNSVSRRKVNRDGMIFFDSLEPLTVSGLSFGLFKTLIEDLVEKSILETKVFVTLGSIRQVEVMVVGEVKKPGLIRLNGLSTIIDALNKAGGINKTGSLRNIKIQTQNKIKTLDLYDIIFPTEDNYKLDIKISNQMVISVPPIQETVMINSVGKKFEIYEMSKDGFKVDDLMKLSGLSSYPGKLSFSIQGFDRNGNEYVNSNIDRKKFLKNGDILNIFQGSSKRIKSKVSIIGAHLDSGVHSLTKYPDIFSIVSNKNVFLDNTYSLSFILKRFNDKKLRHEFITIDTSNVLNKGFNFKLIDNDKLFFLKQEELDYLVSNDILWLLNNKNYIKANSNEESENKDVQKSEENNKECKDLNSS